MTLENQHPLSRFVVIVDRIFIRQNSNYSFWGAIVTYPNDREGRMFILFVLKTKQKKTIITLKYTYVRMGKGSGEQTRTGIIVISDPIPGTSKDLWFFVNKSCDVRPTKSTRCTYILKILIKPLMMYKKKVIWIEYCWWRGKQRSNFKYVFVKWHKEPHGSRHKWIHLWIYRIVCKRSCSKVQVKFFLQ